MSKSLSKPEFWQSKINNGSNISWSIKKYIILSKIVEIRRRVNGIRGFLRFILSKRGKIFPLDFDVLISHIIISGETTKRKETEYTTSKVGRGNNKKSVLKTQDNLKYLKQFYLNTLHVVVKAHKKFF